MPPNSRICYMKRGAFMSEPSLEMVRVVGIDRLELHELKTLVSARGLEAPSPSTDRERHGLLDPLTLTAAIVIAGNASMVLAVWLLRRVRTSKTRYILERETSEGVERLTVEHDEKDVTPATSGVVGKLAKFFRVDPAELIQASADGG